VPDRRQRIENAPVAERSLHHEAEPAVPADGLALELRRLVRVVVLRVIVELVRQPVQRHVEQLVVAQIAHERRARVVAHRAVLADVVVLKAADEEPGQRSPPPRRRFRPRKFVVLGESSRAVSSARL
jgi:hypothetical protein